MQTTTTITRDSETSFIKTLTNENGGQFSRKLEKGNVDYSNACLDFHTAGVKIEIGNFVTK